MKYNRETLPLSERACLEKMKSEGVTVTELNSEEKAKFIEVAKSVYTLFKDKVGNETVDLVR